MSRTNYQKAQEATLARAEEWERSRRLDGHYDKEAIESALASRNAYLGITPTPTLIWGGSPASLGASLWATLRDGLWATLWDRLWDRLWPSLWASLRASRGNSAWISLWPSLWATLRDGLGATLWDRLWPSLWDGYAVALLDCCYSGLRAVHPDTTVQNYAHNLLPAFEAGLGFISFSNNHIGLLPMPECHVDEQSRPHCSDGPAIKWADGTKEWFYHGVRVTEQAILHPESLTLALILNQANVEVQWAMMKLYGEERLLEDVHARVLDEAPQHGATLFSWEWEEDVGGGAAFSRILRVRCPSTGRDFYLHVPPTVKTAKEAVAWTFGMGEEEYDPIKET